MRIPRIYDSKMIPEAGTTMELDEFGANHATKVLRLKAGNLIRLFDGKGHEFECELITAGKSTTVKLLKDLSAEHQRESPITVELLQVISRGDRMDFTIQKAVELGINRIIPLTSERCGVKLDAERAVKKIDSYQKIAIAACEQCGRNVVPVVEPLQSLSSFLSSHQADADHASSPACDADGFINLTLDPGASCKLTELPDTRKYRILIGPEGGFTPEEVTASAQAGFTGVTLGPRILRTETAALVTMAILGSAFGDL